MTKILEEDKSSSNARMQGAYIAIEVCKLSKGDNLVAYWAVQMLTEIFCGSVESRKFPLVGASVLVLLVVFDQGLHKSKR